MKINITTTLFLLLLLSLTWKETRAQSAVYIYKNITKAEADYMCMRGMPSQEEAEMLTLQKLQQLVNSTQEIEKYASTPNKGYGMIIRSTQKLPDGRTIPVYGAALGCKSKKEAETLALENLKRFNPEWEEKDYIEVHAFRDK